MKNEILEIEITKQVNCCKNVAFWNYWDQEHLEVVHKGYQNVQILYETDQCMFSARNIKIPLIGLWVTASILMVQKDENTLVSYATQLGVLSKTTVKIKDQSKDSCEIVMHYKFYLNSWQKLLKPLLKILIPKWNEKVWIEDLPIKLRRQKVLRYNFKDFIGLPKKIEDRKYEGEIKLSIPIPRPKKSLPPDI